MDIFIYVKYIYSTINRGDTDILGGCFMMLSNFCKLKTLLAKGGYFATASKLPAIGEMSYLKWLIGQVVCYEVL